MAIKKANIILTGNDTRSGLSLYYSAHFGRNIVRKFSPLDGERVKKDIAFTGFRQSGNRMKEASPIAAALYHLIPVELKQYSLYRILTGEALKMLKQGIESKEITEKLKQDFINPFLRKEPIKSFRSATKSKSGMGDRPSAIGDFRRFPALRTIEKRTRVRRHNYMLHQAEHNSFQPEQEIQSSHHQPVQHLISTAAQTPQKRSKYPDLVYLGRLPECKKFKMWIRASGVIGQ